MARVVGRPVRVHLLAAAERKDFGAAPVLTPKGFARALEALDSFGVKSQLNQASAKMRGYQIMGVPALVVDGRYVITPSSAGALDNMPKIADALIDKVRSERDE